MKTKLNVLLHESERLMGEAFFENSSSFRTALALNVNPSIQGTITRYIFKIFDEVHDVIEEELYRQNDYYEEI